MVGRELLGRARARLRGAQPLRPGLPLTLLELERDGQLPLEPLPPERVEAASLHVAVVVPSFRQGSGGHSTVANLVRGLEALGHRCSLWLVDAEGRHVDEQASGVDAAFRRFFGPLNARVSVGFDDWSGADVVVATGWQTVAPVLRLPGSHARAYLVQDHEPEFYGTSAERLWAEESYRRGLHHIAASPWLADLLTQRYGATATSFDLGVDHDVYRPLALERRDDLVVLYARAVTPRRAVPLGLLAMAELRRRRPELEIALFGEDRPLEAPFSHRHLGVQPPAELAETYSRATVGVVLSLTNPSLVPTEMLACGLPCVDVASDAMCATFGADGPIALAQMSALGIAGAVEHLLEDRKERAERAAAGRELVAGRTWPAAARQVERGLREALRQAPSGPG